MFHACEKLSICIPVAYQAGAYPSFLSMKRLGVFLLSLGRILVHHKGAHKGVLSAMNLPGLFRHTWVKRGTMAVKGICPGTQHMPPTRPPNWTARFEDKHTNNAYEATACTSTSIRHANKEKEACLSNSFPWRKSVLYRIIHKGFPKLSVTSEKKKIKNSR